MKAIINRFRRSEKRAKKAKHAEVVRARLEQIAGETPRPPTPPPLPGRQAAPAIIAPDLRCDKLP